MATRRGFLAGVLASGLAPMPTWADAGNPAFLSAARSPDGAYVLAGLDAHGAIRFHIPLPARGHAAAAHPRRPEAVAFARRPGTFAVVLDCRKGDALARLDSPRGRHFYGHGTYNETGDLLFTTENDFEAGQGRIGVWDARHGYRRIADLSSHGVGPHDLRLMPDGTLVVANGGIDTHPASGREKLNIPMMRPNLSYLDLEGRVLDQVEPARNLASVRHLSIRNDGLIGIAMQWQGDIAASPALIATHRRDGAWRDIGDGRGLDGYVGSVAFSGDGARLAVTSPRAGMVQVFDLDADVTEQRFEDGDVCGIAGTRAGLMCTNGQGGLISIGQCAVYLARHDLAWDNHLVAIR